MIPTVPFDLIFSVSIGLIFAACARVQFLGGGTPWGRELAAVLSFETIIFWPVALYFLLVHPAWSWMYLVDPARLPRGVSVLVLVADVAALLGGYLLGWALLRTRRERLLYGLLALIGAALLVVSHRLPRAADARRQLRGLSPRARAGRR